MRMLKLFLAAAIPFALLGCPDKANPDPAAKDAGAATPATKAAGPAASGGTAAPAKSGGW